MHHDDITTAGARRAAAPTIGRRGLLAATLGPWALPGTCRAAEGLGTDSVTFVQTADMSGSRVALVKELNAGTQALLSHVNAQGGVHGRRILLRTEDDGYAVERTKAIVERHLRDDSAFAFVSTIGTANAAATLPLLEAARVPLIAPLSGASQLRQAGQRSVFHVRASYAREVAKMVEHATTLGVRRIAVFHDDDAFGEDVLQAAREALAARGLQPAATGKVERGALAVDAAVAAVAAGNPQVVICGSFGKSLVEFITRTRATGLRPSFYALSFFTAGPSAAQLGADARGIVVTQVVPNPKDAGIPVVREFHEHMRQHAPGAARTPIALEGFITGKVLAEGLRRAGPALSRARFVAALESIKELDLGGVHLSYSASNHRGLRYVNIAALGEAGRLIH
jgi:ABC-type branched-subunit amino acid transport system substrate-binding protein